MKTIGRTTVVLLAALLVCGVTWGIGRNMTFTGGQRSNGQPTGQFQPQGSEGTRPEGRGERRGPEGAGSGIFGIVQLLQPLVIIAVLVTLGQYVLRLMRRRFPIGADPRRVSARDGQSGSRQ